MALLGRAGECATLREFLSAAHGDPGGTLVVVGEPGIGKTALVEHVVPAAAIRVAGVEAETGFPYAVLHRLLIPYLNAVDRPAGSRVPGGLRVALGLAERLRVVLGLADRPPAGQVPVARAAAALLTA
ncbi:ATP-binding protein, partial [Actinoplanes subglobosus]